MSVWNATHYLKYGSERTRAAIDLAARIALDSPDAIVDLGCGPGNSTQILRARWPQASICGVDNSPEMLATARESFPDQNWMLADLSEWEPKQPTNLIYANAALQWVGNHGPVVRKLLSLVAPGGALAFQIPSSTFATVRRLIYDISFDTAWTDRLAAARTALTMESPAFYYDELVADSSSLDVWEAEYQHVMESKEAIIDWISSTGLRPFLVVLSAAEQTAFVQQLRDKVEEAYESRIDGKVLFPFRRTFVIAYR